MFLVICDGTIYAAAATAFGALVAFYNDHHGGAGWDHLSGAAQLISIDAIAAHGVTVAAILEHIGKGVVE